MENERQFHSLNLYLSRPGSGLCVGAEDGCQQHGDEGKMFSHSMVDL
jgi:hypothetical protein